MLGSGTGAITATAQPTDGQLLIGYTGADPVLGTLTGTSNQVGVSSTSGTITLSTPQDIATTSSPTFASGIFTGSLTVDTNTLFVNNTNNRVGIGTTAPSHELHVVGDIYSTGGLYLRRRQQQQSYQYRFFRRRVNYFIYRKRKYISFRRYWWFCSGL